MGIFSAMAKVMPFMFETPEETSERHRQEIERIIYGRRYFPPPSRELTRH